MLLSSTLLTSAAVPTVGGRLTAAAPDLHQLRDRDTVPPPPSDLPHLRMLLLRRLA